MTDKERIAELEAEVADNGAMMEIRHQRTVEVDREWQQATGQHDLFPDLGTLIDWLRERARQAEASEARLRDALEMFCGNVGCHEASSFVKGRFRATWEEGNAALSGAGEREHPDTVKLRAVMSWLDERDRAYPADVDIFRSLTEENQRFANMALRSVGVVRDRLSADISRLWCSQLREVIDALKEVERG